MAPTTPNNGVMSAIDDVSSATDGATDGPVSTNFAISTGFVDSLNVMDRIDSLDRSEDMFAHAPKELSWDSSLDISDLHQDESDRLRHAGCYNTTNADSYGLSESSHTQLIQLDSMCLCQCRSLLMSHIPKLEIVMQKAPNTQLDHVLKATEKPLQDTRLLSTVQPVRLDKWT
ncbi:hypothetical protein DV736_g1806, partial [Chaetothyriales sp. CBS 134916]